MKRGFTLIELMIVIAILALLAAIAIPGLMTSLRAANERNASASLKTLPTAQADFRANDRDQNGVHDYWTGDIAGLYCIDNQSTGTANPAPIRLIDVSIALADVLPTAGTLPNGNYGTAVTAYGSLSPKADHWYGTLLEDDQITAQGGNGIFQQDTDGTGASVHNLFRFANGCAPESYGASGTRGFIINQSHTIYERDFGGDLLVSGTFPPVWTGLFDGHWPTDAQLAQFWGRLD